MIMADVKIEELTVANACACDTDSAASACCSDSSAGESCC